VADLEEIKSNEYNLNITRYVDTSEEEVEINIEEVISRISEHEQELAESKDKLNSFLEQLGFERI
jgi:type I restriction enzyme M protein